MVADIRVPRSLTLVMSHKIKGDLIIAFGSPRQENVVSRLSGPGVCLQAGLGARMSVGSAPASRIYMRVRKFEDFTMAQVNRRQDADVSSFPYRAQQPPYSRASVATL